MTDLDFAAKKLAEHYIVPVVVLDDPSQALPAAKALLDGGLPCAEITFRTDAGEESIRLISREYPGMFVGAGTVLTTGQVDLAAAAGAKFIVSPGFDPEVVDYCLETGMPVFPGCVTASEVAQAQKRGLKYLKFFPAEQMGGTATIKALCAAYTGVRFMPTGGIGPHNLKIYMECDKILCCGGSWMIKSELLRGERYDEIARLTKEAVAIAAAVRG